MKYLFFMLMLSFSFSECTDLNVLQCNSDTDCEWIEDINNYSCSGFSQNQCYQYEGCDWTLSYGGSYGSWSHTCSGSYQMDDSYCQENPNPPTCNEMTEFQCISDQDCNWIEDITTGSCSSLGSYDCNSTSDCNWTCSQWGSWYTWICYGSYYCSGGTYQDDYSYCEDNNYIQGDLNGDMILNILDVIIIVDIILNQESNDLADINNDGIVNIIDIVQLVDIIIQN
jgi:hypothetical protein